MSEAEPQIGGRVLSIAGLDPSGGAGILADIKTITMLGGFATGVATAITVQNTMGVSEVVAVDESLVQKQIETILDDIDIEAVKIGMLCNDKIVAAVCSVLSKHKQSPTIVVDPVVLSSSGAKLLTATGFKALTEKLLPKTNILTPNIAEAELLSGISIKTPDDMLIAAKKIQQLGVKNVLVTGGHLEGDMVVDVLLMPTSYHIFESEKLDAPNNHGTGCALSSAIACLIANGCAVGDAVTGAREYVFKALKTAKQIGNGNGPINHSHPIEK